MTGAGWLFVCWFLVEQRPGLAGVRQARYPRVSETVY